jgi:hypothetical protein
MLSPHSAALRRGWNVNELERIGSGAINGCGNCAQMGPYPGPDIRAEHHQRNVPFRQILLIPDVLITRHQHVKSARFSALVKIAIGKLAPIPVLQRSAPDASSDASEAAREHSDQAERGTWV